jgi:hypothetical protein
VRKTRHPGIERAGPSSSAQRPTTLLRTRIVAGLQLDSGDAVPLLRARRRGDGRDPLDSRTRSKGPLASIFRSLFGAASGQVAD